METRTLSRYGGPLPSIFNDFFTPWQDFFDLQPGNFRTLSAPAVNIAELDKKYVISVAAPGMKKNDFKIDVDGNMLVISSETESEKKEEESNYTRREYNYSSFERRFTLPDEVEADKIDAKYEDGVLKINLPRKDGHKATIKKISVQ